MLLEKRQAPHLAVPHEVPWLARRIEICVETGRGNVSSFVFLTTMKTSASSEFGVRLRQGDQRVKRRLEIVDRPDC
jgi:hypothetical protein